MVLGHDRFNLGYQNFASTGGWTNAYGDDLEEIQDVCHLLEDWLGIDRSYFKFQATPPGTEWLSLLARQYDAAIYTGGPPRITQVIDFLRGAALNLAPYSWTITTPGHVSMLALRNELQAALGFPIARAGKDGYLWDNVFRHEETGEWIDLGIKRSTYSPSATNVWAHEVLYEGVYHEYRTHIFRSRFTGWSTIPGPGYGYGDLQPERPFYTGSGTWWAKCEKILLQSPATGITHGGDMKSLNERLRYWACDTPHEEYDPLELRTELINIPEFPDVPETGASATVWDLSSSLVNCPTDKYLHLVTPIKETCPYNEDPPEWSTYWQWYLGAPIYSYLWGLP